MTGPALDWYASWDMPLLAALGFPHASGPRWTCARTRWRSSSSSTTSSTTRWARTLPAWLAPARASSTSSRTPRASPGREQDPCTAAFADVWRRSLDGAPLGWAARAAHEWEYVAAGETLTSREE
ncbi:hypothetical protein [Embleya sp. NPDC001921]